MKSSGAVSLFYCFAIWLVSRASPSLFVIFSLVFVWHTAYEYWDFVPSFTKNLPSSSLFLNSSFEIRALSFPKRTSSVGFIYGDLLEHPSNRWFVSSQYDCIPFYEIFFVFVSNHVTTSALREWQFLPCQRWTLPRSSLPKLIYLRFDTK